MTFTKANTVEQMILDAAAHPGGKQASMAREDAPHYRGESLVDHCAQRDGSMPSTPMPRRAPVHGTGLPESRV